jgi:hypothetical protein
MSYKKIVTEDIYPDGSWAASFRAGDEVDPAIVKAWGLEDKVVDIEEWDKRVAKAAVEEAKAADAAAKARDKAIDALSPKSSDKNIDPAPDSPNGEANDPTSGRKL